MSSRISLCSPHSLIWDDNFRADELTCRVDAVDTENTKNVENVLPDQSVRTAQIRAYEMDDVYHNVSRVLYRVMDAIGASEDMRSRYRESAMLYEISGTTTSNILFQGQSLAYRFGSSCEGTTTPGLQSDLDILSCSELISIVETTEEAPCVGMTYLMVTGAATKPGYIHLQTLINRVPLTIHHRPPIPWLEAISTEGRICLKHIILFHGLHETVRNGPADFCRKGITEQDFVTALRCRTVPKTASLWLHRERPCGWPSARQLRTMESYGCFVVGVGHPTSLHKSIEWRISFSLQERDMMASLNPMQHKIYILLKMIKKDIIQRRAGDKSISSYHCKTCIFHIIETTQHFVWARRNLIHGIRLCLECLLRWARKGNCPNYFIPTENMFDRIDKNTLTKVADVLDEILSSGVGFLSSLKCDNVGKLLCRCIAGLSFADMKKEIKFTRDDPFIYYMFCNASYVQQDRNRLLHHICSTNAHLDTLSKLLRLLEYLQHTDSLRFYERRDVRMALSFLAPHIHLQIAQCIASTVITTRGSSQPNRVANTFLHHLLEGRSCDLISTRLILATWYLHCGMLDECERILLTSLVSITPYVTSICYCYSHSHHLDHLPERVTINQQLSNKDLQRQLITCCMVFLPSQAKFVHAALRYEMYRSRNTPPGLRNDFMSRDFWYDWTVVDSRVYLHFLQYILYSKTNNTVFKQDAIDDLRHLLHTDLNLGHKETAYNLLGWILTQENKPQDAWKCFCRSWRIRPFHNAAKWHLAAMLYQSNKSGK